MSRIFDAPDPITGLARFLEAKLAPAHQIDATTWSFRSYSHLMTLKAEDIGLAETLLCRLSTDLGGLEQYETTQLADLSLRVTLGAIRINDGSVALEHRFLYPTLKPEAISRLVRLLNSSATLFEP